MNRPCLPIPFIIQKYFLITVRLKVDPTQSYQSVAGELNDVIDKVFTEIYFMKIESYLSHRWFWHPLSADQAMPKELLPIVDKPLIQYAVEEAIAAGIDTIIFVTGRNSRVKITLMLILNWKRCFAQGQRCAG